MKIPKKIDVLLEKRVRLANQLSKLNWELESFIEENGGNLSDSDIFCGVCGHVMIYEEPEEAEDIVRDYIKTKM